LCFNLCEYPACPSLADRKSKGPSQPEEKGHPRPPVVRRKTEKGTYVSKKTREIKPEHRKNGVEEFRSQNLRYESGHTPTKGGPRSLSFGLLVYSLFLDAASHQATQFDSRQRGAWEYSIVGARCVTHSPKKRIDRDICTLACE